MERSDKRKEAEPKPRKETGGAPAAGKDETASQETGFTGKKTYEFGRQDKDADE